MLLCYTIWCGVHSLWCQQKILKCLSHIRTQFHVFYHAKCNNRVQSDCIKLIFRVNIVESFVAFCYSWNLLKYGYSRWFPYTTPFNKFSGHLHVRCCSYCWSFTNTGRFSTKCRSENLQTSKIPGLIPDTMSCWWIVHPRMCIKIRRVFVEEKNKRFVLKVFLFDVTYRTS